MQMQDMYLQKMHMRSKHTYTRLMPLPHRILDPVLPSSPTLYSLCHLLEALSHPQIPFLALLKCALLFVRSLRFIHSIIFSNVTIFPCALLAVVANYVYAFHNTAHHTVRVTFNHPLLASAYDTFLTTSIDHFFLSFAINSLLSSTGHSFLFSSVASHIVNLTSIYLSVSSAINFSFVAVSKLASFPVQIKLELATIIFLVAIVFVIFNSNNMCE
ncbi:hypothetical protein VNO78_16230 [Psophocarpus tetragonolobus]|uniref:Uncharacterized protein n=1 Tax=Psophocarpus tetragonolobus TaxID=3891 RepID=A0AAN9SHY6_PSOTE